MRWCVSRVMAGALLLLAGTAGAENIRSFGEVRSAGEQVKSGAVRRFTCETPEAARTLMHKAMRDLAQTATESAAWQTLEVGGRKVPVLVRSGLGAFLPLVQGSSVMIYTATTPEALAAVTVPAEAELYNPDYQYPAYLDKYSRWGIGCWYPSNWGDGNTKGKPNTVNDHFRFAREMDLVLQPNAGGHLLRNLLPKLREYGRPFHFAEWQEWSPTVALLAPEELVTVNSNFSTMPHYYGQISDGGHRLMAWNNWRVQQRVKQFVDEPLLIDWPDPNGEVGPMNEDYIWDFTENNRKNFVRFLQTARGYTLPELGKAWYGDPKHFSSWDEVPIPMSYEFYGWAPDSIMAERSWRLHPVPVGKELEEGLKAGFQGEKFDDSKWVELPAPGNELFSIFWRADRLAWYRGTIEVPAEWLEKKRAAGPIYLTAATLTEGRGTAKPDRLWLNGQELGAWSFCGGYMLRNQFDVTKLLKPGRNVIAYLPAHSSFRGAFFLSDRKLEDYPFADSGLNARYVDWNEYISWAIADMLEHTYQAIRAIDPNRFIKMHAFQRKDYGTVLAAKYGAAQHNTGDEAFFRPWDRRFGYVRGVPASCEPSGSVDTPDHFKTWLGWHTFTGGLNALDYFHNIQSMMYSPAAPLWKKYLPYWKLAPRRQLKQPQLAFFFSSFNNKMLPRPVPYCFDPGRGDIQALGYSYVYVDEATVRDGLIDRFPVIWDTGSWVLDEKTVEGLQKYVENGGTLVLLQETGRHTPTQADAWPISKLTGFRVKELRPMNGTLSIMNDQPLFKKLAGQNFYNEGRSVDYSDYNYADKCAVLEPVAPGTSAVARYSDGEIAIGLRQLGKGRVIVLGSPFWRDSYDARGLWWPGPKQNAFLSDLLPQLGLAPVAESSVDGVWREHYLSTNGAEEFLALFNPAGEEVTATITWKPVNPPGALYDPKDASRYEAEVRDGTVVLKDLTLHPYETLIVATQPRQAPEAVVDSWYRQFAGLWRPVAGGKVLDYPELPIYELRLADQLLGKEVTPEEFKALPKLPENLVLGACQSPTANLDRPDPNRRCVLVGKFELPKSWNPETDDIKVSLRGFTHAVGNVVGPVDAWLNGEKILTQGDISAQGYNALQHGKDLPVSPLLKRDGENVLVLAMGPNGFEGEVTVLRRPKPEASLEVTGEWQVQQDPDSGLSRQQLPGELNAMYAFRDVEIPAEWRGDRVFVKLDLTGELDSFAINGKVIFHPVNWFPAVYDMDVTPWVKFGEPNRFYLITRGATRLWAPEKVNLRKFEIQRIKADAVKSVRK